MKTKSTRYRVLKMPSHRTLGMYLLIKSWTLGVDCVAIRRKKLLKYLGLERMQEKRTIWLQEDLEDFFPFRKIYKKSKKNRYTTLYLSRYKIPKRILKIKTRIKDRTKQLNDYGLKTAVVELPSESKVIKFVEPFFRGVTLIDIKP